MLGNYHFIVIISKATLLYIPSRAMTSYLHKRPLLDDLRRSAFHLGDADMTLNSSLLVGVNIPVVGTGFLPTLCHDENVNTY